MDFVTVLAWFFVAATLACVSLWLLILVMLLVEMAIALLSVMRKKS